MIEALLVVLSRPLDNRHDEFNDWYSNIHVRDALRFRGSIATRRFSLNESRPAGYNNPFGWRYLALYEVSDANRFVQEHVEAVGTVRMEISDSFDVSAVNDYHYYPVAFRDADPGAPDDGGVVMEQINTRPGAEEAFREWYETDYMPKAARMPGVKSAALLAYRPHGQMLPHDAEFNFVAVYRLSDMAAMAAWNYNDALLDCPHIEPDKLAVSAWDPVEARLTKDAVLNPTSSLLASEEKARAAMGDRTHRSTGDELTSR